VLVSVVAEWRVCRWPSARRGGLNTALSPDPLQPTWNRLTTRQQLPDRSGLGVATWQPTLAAVLPTWVSGSLWLSVVHPPGKGVLDARRV